MGAFPAIIFRIPGNFSPEGLFPKLLSELTQLFSGIPPANSLEIIPGKPEECQLYFFFLYYSGSL